VSGILSENQSEIFLMPVNQNVSGSQSGSVTLIGSRNLTFSSQNVSENESPNATGSQTGISSSQSANVTESRTQTEHESQSVTLTLILSVI
jgi:hypothetical protein